MTWIVLEDNCMFKMLQNKMVFIYTDEKVLYPKVILLYRCFTRLPVYVLPGYQQASTKHTVCVTSLFKYFGYLKLFI